MTARPAPPSGHQLGDPRPDLVDDLWRHLIHPVLVARVCPDLAVFTDELMAVIDDIAARLDPTNAEAARTTALTIFGMMIGTLQLAGTLTDRDLSNQLLARGVETAVKLLAADEAA
jgi:hypothetical protein